jgi:hypothetical protein
MKPLIILGNGKSLAEINLNELTYQDTFGLNGAYLKFQEIQWFPKYYGSFVRGPNKWKDVSKFINENYLKIEKFFLFENKAIDYRSRIQHIVKQYPSVINIDKNLYEFPFFYDYQEALDELSKDQDIPSCNTRDYDLMNKLTKEGIKKYLRRQYLSEMDYITLPRYKVSWVPPQSFSEFTFSGGVAGVIACLVGYLLGYKKILLLGMDCNWVTNNNIVDTKQTYWFENYFNKTEYNIKEFCSECTPESLQKMHLDSWQNLKEMIEVNKLNIEIINCTPNSQIPYFNKSNVKTELG